MAVRLEHANLTVRDIEGMIRFLQTAFPEFRVRGEGKSRDGSRWVHMGTDETYIALSPANAMPEKSWTPYRGLPGANHLAYEVDDVEALCKRMKSAGFRESTPPNAHPHRKRRYFYDSEGNDWEFVPYLSQDPAERNDYKLRDTVAHVQSGLSSGDVAFSKEGVTDRLRIDRVLETALYVEEMGRAIEFYRRIFGFPVLLRSAEPDRLTALDIGGAQALLLCKKGASMQAVVTPGGEIPPCDGSGNSHLAFPIALSQLDAWEKHLLVNGIAIESKVQWERGGQSLYFRDPDGNLLELATPGLWSIY